MRQLAVSLLIIVLAGGGARTPLATIESGRGLEAVGRLDLGDGAFCTATLISPDEALTAAHCLYEGEGGAPRPPGSMQLRLGWRSGRAKTVRDVAAAIAHPDYRFGAADSMRRRGGDIALLRLTRPVSAADLSPVAVGARPARGDRVGVLAYGEDTPDLPMFEGDCRMLSGSARLVMLDCTVTPGASGAPVFAGDARSGRRLVSVISATAKAGDTPVAIAVDAASALERLRGRLADAEALGGDTQRRFQGSGGARFLSAGEP